MPTTDSIAGHVAVVVGAAGGMGQAIVGRLGAAGCRLVLIDLEPGALDGVVRDLSLKDSAITIPADITDPNQIASAAQAASARFGGVDILINAAGTNTKQRTLDDLSPEQWERVIAVNLSGVFHCTQAFLPLLKQQRGIVITIASTAALRGTPGGGTAYCASKRALISLNESINAEQGKHGVRACVICPGEVDTPLIEKRPVLPSAERRAAMLKPEDIADTVHFIVTRPPHVTISDLVVWPSAQISGTYTV